MWLMMWILDKSGSTVGTDLGQFSKHSFSLLRQQIISTASNSCDPGVSGNMSLIIFSRIDFTSPCLFLSFFSFSSYFPQTSPALEATTVWVCWWCVWLAKGPGQQTLHIWGTGGERERATGDGVSEVFRDVITMGWVYMASGRTVTRDGGGFTSSSFLCLSGSFNHLIFEMTMRGKLMRIVCFF